MAATERVERLAKEVSAFVDQEGAVAWVGAGMSRAVGYQSWEGTVRKLCDACSVAYPNDPAARELMDVAERCRNTDVTACRSVLMELFGTRPRALQRDAYLYLARLPLAGYVTTNFDPELIVAVELAPDRGFQEVRYPDDLDPALLRLPEVTPLYFAHGRADATDPESADTLVLGTADFSLAYEEPGAVRSLVSALLLRHPVLFLGAEMRDPHFRRVVDEVSRLQGQLDEAYRGHLKRPPRLALIGAPLDEADDGPKRPGDLENSQRLEELDIQVRWYDSSNLHMELDDVLRLAADASGKLSTVVRERGLFAGDDTQ